MLALTVGAATFLTFHAGAVMTLLYGDADATWGPVLAALAWSAVGTGTMYIQGSYLLVRQRLRLINGIFRRGDGGQRRAQSAPPDAVRRLGRGGGHGADAGAHRGGGVGVLPKG